MRDAACFSRVADILALEATARTGVVVSAMGGMTDSLLRLTALAERDDSGFRSELREIGSRYTETAKQLLNAEALVGLLDQWTADADDIESMLVTIAQTKSAPQRSRDIVAGFGEIWSARLLAAYLAKRLGEDCGGTWIDAREVVTVRHGDLGPAVQWDVSRVQFARQLDSEFTGIAVITGFIASDEEKLQTTLGRNGSDYSAAIFAALSDADQVNIWTDVDGVMSADPNKVPEARIINSLSYDEAMELAYFGAKVLHPQTLGPAVENNIPIYIRNTFQPTHPGSRISDETDTDEKIKGITAVGNMALINLEGAGMIGVPGTADRLFRALKNAGVSVPLISQASSEHSICIAVPADLASRATEVITAAFVDELADGQIQSVDVTDDQSIIAVVGDGMAGSPGVAARFFANLGRANINVRAIAQGSSERNISAVVDSKEVTRALRTVHTSFYLASKTLSIGLIGPGTVGAALLDQISQQAAVLKERSNIDLRISAIARSQTMVLGDRRIELENWRESVASSTVPANFDLFEQHVNPDHLPHAVIVDCTADQAIADRYAGWLESGIHVITPNKKAFSGAQEAYDDLRTCAGIGGSHYLYETTVGAGLPIITTLRELIDTGDQVRSVEGILSGTLAYLFNVYDGTRPFSEIVIDARNNGYTEPDPRDDLSGMDVARKLTILARELGQEIEIGQFPVENLVAEDLQSLSVDSFLAELKRYDDDIKERFDSAAANGQRLRYVARLDSDGNANVGLEQVDADHAFSNINLTDNIVQFTSDRYADNPLVVQGPGAGPAVTAGGVFGDLLKLASFLGDGTQL